MNISPISPQSILLKYNLTVPPLCKKKYKQWQINSMYAFIIPACFENEGETFVSNFTERDPKATKIQSTANYTSEKKGLLYCYSSVES